ncbi:hypothetical protein DPMN_017256 [Dreissena polymorpha]|uniref:Uncharacterized protein n=1 Tax=Dreissena polymorpha TaxID=45954 RepID=A0A9D4NH48_DREPO|nr:hypothetical protein DPMN_017256 [Dreissena polymorpha]
MCPQITITHHQYQSNQSDVSITTAPINIITTDKSTTGPSFYISTTTAQLSITATDFSSITRNSEAPPTTTSNTILPSASSSHYMYKQLLFNE